MKLQKRTTDKFYNKESKVEYLFEYPLRKNGFYLMHEDSYEDYVKHEIKHGKLFTSFPHSLSHIGVNLNKFDKYHYILTPNIPL